MNKLLPKAKLDAHVQEFPGIDPVRKREIADHLSALPESHHVAVRTVLEVPDDQPETHFVRGCFDNPEHPGLPSAA